MGYAFMMGQCFSCRQVFTFNPVRVPSVRDKNRERQPICGNCMNKVNMEKESLGLPCFLVPSDAYEACHEDELT